MDAGIITASDYGCTDGNTCTPPNGYKFCNWANIDMSGFATAADAAAAADNNDTNYATCLDDPRNDQFVVNSPDDQKP